MIDAEAEQLREALPADRRLLVVADHGMVDVPADDRIDVADDAGAARRASPCSAARRGSVTSTASRGAVHDVLATWRATLGDRAEVLTRAEAIGCGWFGPVDPACCRGSVTSWWRAVATSAVLSTDGFPYENRLIGMHGSLTADEMLIPLLVD